MNTCSGGPLGIDPAAWAALIAAGIALVNALAGYLIYLAHRSGNGSK